MLITYTCMSVKLVIKLSIAVAEELVTLVDELMHHSRFKGRNNSVSRSLRG